jgi:hypothetical protein
MYVITVIKSSTMRWAGHVAHMGVKSNIYRVLVVKLGEKRTL